METILTLNTDNQLIRTTRVHISYVICSLCYERINKGAAVVSIFLEEHNQCLWLCPGHIVGIKTM